MAERDSTTQPLRAVVTGASSGMGRASVTKLKNEGWDVVAVARRADMLETLAAETGAHPYAADVTDSADVARLVSDVTAAGEVHALLNIAGGAIGTDSIENGDVDDWKSMYDVNTLGVLRVTQGLLPALRESGRGDVLVLSSTAGHVSYEGGGGYVAAKHGATVIAETLRLELVGEPIRVIEIAPGMVATEEFSRKRLGDADKAAKVYEGVEEPLTAEDIADAVVWTLTRPHHVNIDLMVMRPIAQAAQHKVARGAGL